MKKKILFTASTYSHINNFHIPYIKFLKDRGDTVHVMVGGKLQEILYADRVIEIQFEKKITSPKNFMLAIKMAKILKKEKYDIINFIRPQVLDYSRLGVFFVTNVLLVQLQTSILPMFYGCKFVPQLPLIYAPSLDQCRLCLHLHCPILI